MTKLLWNVSKTIDLATSEIFIEQSGSEQQEATCLSISLAVVVDVVVVGVNVVDVVVVVIVDDDNEDVVVFDGNYD